MVIGVIFSSLTFLGIWCLTFGIFLTSWIASSIYYENPRRMPTILVGIMGIGFAISMVVLGLLITFGYIG